MEKINYQILKPFITVCEKGTMAICQYAYVKNGIMVYSNLETEVQINTTLPDGFYQHIEGEFHIQEFEVEEGSKWDEDYPLSNLNNKHEEGSLILRPQNEVSPENMANLAACAANDEMRPAMEGIFINETDMVASDAHVLRTLPVHDENEFTPGIEILTSVPKVLVSALQKHKSSTVSVEKYTDDNQYHSAIKYTFHNNPDNLIIIVREIEANYPNYKGVLPERNNYQYAFQFNQSQAADYIRFAKKILPENGRLFFNNGIPELKNIDTNMEKQFPKIKEVDVPACNYSGIIMPMFKTEGEQTIKQPILSAFNLQKFIKGFKGNIVIAVNDPTRALAVWLFPETKSIRKPVSRKKPATNNQKPIQQPYCEPMQQGKRFKVTWNSIDNVYVVNDSEKNKIVFVSYSEHDAQAVRTLLNMVSQQPNNNTATQQHSNTATQQHNSNTQPATKLRVLFSNAS